MMSRTDAMRSRTDVCLLALVVSSALVLVTSTQCMSFKDGVKSFRLKKEGYVDMRFSVPQDCPFTSIVIANTTVENLQYCQFANDKCSDMQNCYCKNREFTVRVFGSAENCCFAADGSTDNSHNNDSYSNDDNIDNNNNNNSENDDKDDADNDDDDDDDRATVTTILGAAVVVVTVVALIAVVVVVLWKRNSARRARVTAQGTSWSPRDPESRTSSRRGASREEDAGETPGYSTVQDAFAPGIPRGARGRGRVHGSEPIPEPEGYGLDDDGYAKVRDEYAPGKASGRATFRSTTAGASDRMENQDMYIPMSDIQERKRRKR